MEQNTKSIVLSLFILFIPVFTLAQLDQQEFRTMQGKLIVTGQVGDSSVMVITHKLMILLNYSTAELSIRVCKEDVRQKLEDFSSEPLSQYNTDLLFKGKLGLDEINTRKHPPLDFEVVGYMVNKDKNTLVKGSGHLEHIHADQYACVLNLDFKVSPEILNIEWPGDEEVRIQIIQTVLKRSSDQ